MIANRLKNIFNLDVLVKYIIMFIHSINVSNHILSDYKRCFKEPVCKTNFNGTGYWWLKYKSYKVQSTHKIAATLITIDCSNSFLQNDNGDCDNMRARWIRTKIQSLGQQHPEFCKVK